MRVASGSSSARTDLSASCPSILVYDVGGVADTSSTLSAKAGGSIVISRVQWGGAQVRAGMFSVPCVVTA